MAPRRRPTTPATPYTSRYTGARKDDLRIVCLSIHWTPEHAEHETPGEETDHCIAKASISYRIGLPGPNENRRLEWLTSSGQGNVTRYASVSGGTAALAELQEQRSFVADMELEDLRLHLRHFGIDPSDTEWRQLRERTQVIAR